MKIKCSFVKNEWSECMKEMRRVNAILFKLDFLISVPGNVHGFLNATKGKLSIEFVFSTVPQIGDEHYLRGSNVIIEGKQIIVDEEDGVVVLSGKEVAIQVK